MTEEQIKSLLELLEKAIENGVLEKLTITIKPKK